MVATKTGINCPACGDGVTTTVAVLPLHRKTGEELPPGVAGPSVIDPHEYAVCGPCFKRQQAVHAKAS